MSATNRSYRIAHIADIHVKNRRRREYAVVFDRLVADIREANTEAPINVIAIAGDTFDTMTTATANNWADVAGLLSRLADVAPVVIIPGNHDLNVNAPGAPDLISPMIVAAGGAKELQAPRLTYWRHSGVFEHAGAVWVVGAPDEPLPAVADAGELVGAARARGDKPPLIGIFHETVDGARFPNGQDAVSERFAKRHLAEVAAAATGDTPCAILLGDIHARQEVPFAGSGDRAAAWYPGSLVAQTFGEGHVGHGWLLWELHAGFPCGEDVHIPPTVRVAPRDIFNDRAALTVVLADGVDITPEPRPKRPRSIRLRHDDATSPDVVAATAAALETTHKLRLRSVELGKTYQLTAAAEPHSVPAPTHPDALSAARIASQSWARHEEYIRAQLVDMAPELVEAVVSRHRASVAYQLGDTAAAARVKLVRLAFDNMYCYGGGNAIDFTAMASGRPGLTGLIASNRAGKSSLFDIITYALFDVAPRGSKPDVARRGTKGFSLSLEFEVDGSTYTIAKTKSGVTHGVKQRLTKLRPDGSVEDLTGKDVNTTVKTMRDLVGVYDHAAATAFARPSDVTGQVPFAQQTPDQRRTTLSSLLKLGVFDGIKKQADKDAVAGRAAVRALWGTVPAQFRGACAVPGAADIESVRGHVVALESSADEDGSAAADADDAVLASRDALEAAHAAENALAITVGQLRAEEAVAKPSQPADCQLNPPDGYDLAGEVPKTKAVLAEAERAADLARAELDRCLKGSSASELKAAAAEAAEKLATAIARRDAARSRAQGNDRATTEILRAELLALNAKLEAGPTREVLVDRKATADRELGKLRDVAGSLAPLMAEEKYRQLKATCAQLAEEAEAAPSSGAHGSEVVAADRLEQAKLWAGRLRAELPPSPARSLEDARKAAVEYLGALPAGRPDPVRAARVLDDLTAAAVREGESRRAEAVLVQADAEVSRIAKAAALAQSAASRAKKVKLLAEKLKDEEAARQQHTSLQLSTAEAEARIAQLTAQIAEADSNQKRAAELELELHSTQLAELDAQISSLEATAAATCDTFQAAQKAAVALKEAAARRDAARQAACCAAFWAARAAHGDIVARLGNAETEMVRAHAVSKAAREAADRAADAAARLHAAAAKAQSEADTLSRLIDGDGETRGLAEVTRELDIVLAYRKILDPKSGLASSLLADARSTVDAEINSALRQAEADFAVELGADYSIVLADDAQAGTATSAPARRVPAAMGSGYQHFILDLASRMALIKVSQAPLLECLLIDEGFGCLDGRNLPKVANALVALAESPRSPLVVAVTHRDDLRPFFSHRMSINTTHGISRIVWPTENGAAPPPEAADLAPAADGVAGGPPPAAKEPGDRSELEPVEGGRLRCPPCDKTFGPNWAEKHLASAAHAKVVTGTDQAAGISAAQPDVVAHLGGLQLKCLRCDFELKVSSWARHEISLRHLKSA
jgi:DNA repair exonuclease SbcCD nuclease subunit